MEALELLDLIEAGESTKIQFKQQIDDSYKMGTEMVAFANSQGGRLIIGVNDKTAEIVGLSARERDDTNNRLSNISDNNVKPAIYITTENVKIEDKWLVVATIPEAISKPVLDNKGIVWLKNGSDKRRVTSQDEMRRLFQSTGVLYADEQVIEGTTVNDVNKDILDLLLKEKSNIIVEDLEIPLKNQLQNLRFLENESLTLAGLLLLSDRVQQFRPYFTVKCVAFEGTELSTSNFKDKPDAFQGNLLSLYEQSMAFLKRNLRKIQVKDGFNTRAQLEISEETLEELVVNSLIHRNYFIQSEIKVFIFDDRVEIISPGNLPNTLTVENIKAGTSIGRNPILYSNAPYLLPLVGVGTGIPRAIKHTPNLELINDKDRELFIAKLKRPKI